MSKPASFSSSTSQALFEGNAIERLFRWPVTSEVEVPARLVCPPFHAAPSAFNRQRLASRVYRRPGGGRRVEAKAEISLIAWLYPGEIRRKPMGDLRLAKDWRRTGVSDLNWGNDQVVAIDCLSRGGVGSKGEAENHRKKEI